MARNLQQYLEEIPKLPPVDTHTRLVDYSEGLYNIDPSTHLYKFIDALTGDAGAADLKKQLAVARLNNSLESTHFFDLDRLFGNILQLERLTSENYPYNPFNDMLTDEQWDEVRVKDSWYRARCQDFLTACSLGGTLEGFTVMTHAALGTTCDVYEVWRYMDDLGVSEELGRTNKRNEVVVRPHKENLTDRERRLLLQALDRIKPIDIIITIDVHGVGLHKPVDLTNVSADSSYFEIQRWVTGSPDLNLIPPPEYLREEVFDGETWITPDETSLAPTVAKNSTQESSVIYQYHDQKTSAIDEVTYSIYAKGEERKEVDFIEFGGDQTVYSDWINFPLADSPDNYPGGRGGRTPYREPAINTDGTPYAFPYQSQKEYVDEMREMVLTGGGEVSGNRYRIVLTRGGQRTHVIEPSSVFKGGSPTGNSKVTTGWYDERVDGAVVAGEDPR